ncbi:hypothetical protein P389DRAFT_208144 [Cystobasidium minutum MCA 4210]|uniref:uncharacterized protein n=1 Tax=Cystobasidium minutum MCA 4210 TaxID=1397322 RepID=UPI0034CDC664|eukprot:jgi/Rhomi1/208144/estExt_Genemark1.C_1_t30164
MPSYFRRLLSKVEVQQDKTGEKATKDQGNTPAPPEACTWGIVDFCAVLPWPALAIIRWTSGSMLLSLGLNVKQAISMSIVAYFVITITSIAAGHVGVVYRLSDPLSSRLAWGVRGYLVTLVIQVCVATCYYGIQLVYGYLSLKVVIGAMAPSFLTMHNSFSTNLPTNDFICMVIFLAISGFLQAFGVGAWRQLGRYAGTFTFITFIAITAVCCGRAGGAGPLLREPYELVGIGGKPSNSQVAWGSFLAVSSLLGNNAMLYECNFTRFSRNFSAPFFGQVLSHMVLPLIVTVFGILSTSAALEIFPDEDRLLWAPYELLLVFQREGGARARAATFFAGLVLVMPQLGINVAWNAFGTGVSYSTLFPRWFTVRRGGYLTLVLAVAINPWEFAARPTGFNRFLNGAAILYGALSGIFLVDYLLLRKRYVRVSHLLKTDTSSIYWYTKGCNWRAVVATALSVWLPFPGWVMIIRNPENVLNNAWERLYGLAWMLCFVIAGLIYYILGIVWPMPGLYETDAMHEADRAEGGSADKTAAGKKQEVVSV